MAGHGTDRETAVEIAKAYADEECTGEFGEVTDVDNRESDWQIEFKTHTFSDTYTHRIKVTKSVGNVVAHDRSSRFD